MGIQIDRMWDRWKLLMGDDRESANSFNDLAERYQSEPHRSYHTFEHLEELLKFADDYFPSKRLADYRWRASLLIAIWYHDAVYDPKASEGRNETDSYKLYLKHNVKALSTTDSDGSIRRCIMATIDQTPVSVDIDQAEYMMIDCDLSILGSDSFRFARYCEQIRSEYEHVPERLYRPARIKVLESFLQRPFIYAHTRVRTEIGEQAVTNLKNEIARLSK